MDLEAILFADDPIVTRDFLYSFVNDAVSRNMQDVHVKGCHVTMEGDVVVAHINFVYDKGNENFNVDLSLKGAMYE